LTTPSNPFGFASPPQEGNSLPVPLLWRGACVSKRGGSFCHCEPNLFGVAIYFFYFLSVHQNTDYKLKLFFPIFQISIFFIFYQCIKTQITNLNFFFQFSKSLLFPVIPNLFRYLFFLLVDAETSSA